MAYKINLHDTHRTPYNNATITARPATGGSTDPVTFEDYAGSPLGTEIHTNARGFLCDANGALYTNGVFVPMDSVITVTLKDGTTTSWVVTKDNTVAINDAKLWNADKTKILFTANADKDFILSYYDLSDRPLINEWGTEEQTVEIDAVTDTLNVAKLTRVIHLWSQLNYEDFDDDPVNDPEVVLNLVSTVTPPCFGQRFSVLNSCRFRVKLVNSDGTFIATVEPWTTKQISAIATTDGTGIFFHDDHARMGYAGYSQGLTLCNSDPLVINDYTADILFLRDDADTPQDTARIITVRQDLTYSRQITLWWQPRQGKGCCQNLILQSEDGFQFAKLHPYSPVTYMFRQGNTIGNSNAPVEFCGKESENFGLHDDYDVTLTNIAGAYHSYPYIRWPTGATSVSVLIANAIAGGADLASSPIVTLHLAINQVEVFDQLVRVQIPNFNDSAGKWLRIRFVLHKVRPDGSTDAVAVYESVDGQDIGTDTQVFNSTIGGLLKVAGGMVGFFQQT